MWRTAIESFHDHYHNTDSFEFALETVGFMLKEENEDLQGVIEDYEYAKQVLIRAINRKIEDNPHLTPMSEES